MFRKWEKWNIQKCGVFQMDSFEIKRCSGKYRFVEWEERNTRTFQMRRKDSFESKRKIFFTFVLKNKTSGSRMFRKGSFEAKTLESGEKIRSENEKRGITGSRMFQMHRKGSFESKIYRRVRKKRTLGNRMFQMN